jgi:hypothetical protein
MSLPEMHFLEMCKGREPFAVDLISVLRGRRGWVDAANEM